MEFVLFINQIALKRWFEKFDGDDAILVAFISNLNPENEAIASYMRDGFFMLNRTFLRQQLPMLNFSEDWISRRLKRLQDIGLVDLRHYRSPDGKHTLYGRLSKLYWREVERAKQHAHSFPVYKEINQPCQLEVGQSSQLEVGQSNHGTRDHLPTDDYPIDQCNDQREGVSAAPSGGAAAVSPEGRRATEDEIEKMKGMLPWLKRKSPATRAAS